MKSETAERRMVAQRQLLILDGVPLCVQAHQILAASFDITLNTRGMALPEALRNFDVIWTRLSQRISVTSLPEDMRARWLAVPMTGLAHIDESACARRGLGILSLRGETEFLRSVRATAEHTLALLLALLRDVPRAAYETRSGIWRRDGHEGTEIHGKTVGIVGVGRLGRIVADYLAAMGANVVGFDPSLTTPKIGPVVLRASLCELLAESDIVTLHADLNPSSRGMIGREALRRVKPGAVLVNTARGALIDSAALLDALRDGRLRGAAVDVLESEPEVTFDDPLLVHARTSQNLLITPHLGGYTRESVEKTEMFLARRLLTIAPLSTPP